MARSEFSQEEAANLASADERKFRQWVDRRMILPTAETRFYGRGKAKLFDTSEIAIARVLGKAARSGIDMVTQTQIADWLRSHSGGDFFQRAKRGEPVYVRLCVAETGEWSGDFALAHTHGKELKIPVTRPMGDEPADFMMIFNLNEVFQVVDALFTEEETNTDTP
ncbi:hypothetical protein [Magnetospirillum fulvum]|nr:hypothetical protein [Magnetospirillum fulvum]